MIGVGGRACGAGAIANGNKYKGNSAMESPYSHRRRKRTIKTDHKGVIEFTKRGLPAHTNIFIIPITRLHKGSTLGVIILFLYSPRSGAGRPGFRNRLFCFQVLGKWSGTVDLGFGLGMRAGRGIEGLWRRCG